MRVGAATLANLPAAVAAGAYDRDGQAIGIVHFGIGAFHRAHMAWYTDLALGAGERDWLISGVSLRSMDVAQQLNPQDGYYTLTERSQAGADTRLIGAVREVLFAPEAGGEVVARLADPACRIVSFTVTEKGYARAGDGTLDLTLAEVSFYPLLTRGLARRRAQGSPGLTLLSCDNLADNGRVLRKLMRQWLTARAPDLLGWFDAECRVPSTMINRIVPRTSEEDRAELAGRIGIADEGAVFAEPFSQWVIEDDFAQGRPAWESHGAQLVADVSPYETAKLRMLNGAHSLLAYCGLRSGHDFVHEAVADPILRDLASRLMLEEAASTIDPAEGQDLGAYAAALLERFANPALRHSLAQIAMDGTQKIPQRWLDTALARHAAGLASPAIARAFAAWLWHIEDGRFVDDPQGTELRRLAAAEGSEAMVAHCFGQLWPAYAALAQHLSSAGS